MSESSILGAANATLRATSPHISAASPLPFSTPKAIPGTAWRLPGIAGLAIAEAIMGDDGRLKPFEQLRHSNIITQPFLRKLGSFLGSKYYQMERQPLNPSNKHISDGGRFK